MNELDRVLEAQAKYEEAELHANYHVLFHKLGTMEGELAAELRMKLAESYSDLLTAIEQYRSIEQ